MRLSIAASFIALLGIGASLPLTNSTRPGVVDIDDGILLYDTPTNLTTGKSSWTETIEASNASMFGLLQNFQDAAAHHDLHAKDNHIDIRGEPVPRNRKVAEQMKSLPECFQTCFRNENGKTSVDIYAWDLDKFCYMPSWVLTHTWIMYHILPCWKWQCRDHMDEIKWAGKRWMQETCP